MSYRDHHWLFLTQEELNAKSTSELVDIMRWAQYILMYSDVGTRDSELTAAEKRFIELRAKLKIRVKNALIVGMFRAKPTAHPTGS